MSRNQPLIPPTKQEKEQSVWERIRDAYVRGYDVDGVRIWPTMRALARKYDVKYDGVSGRAERGKWGKARTKFQEKFEQRMDDEVMKRLGQKAVALRLKGYDVSRQILEAVEYSLAYQSIDEEGNNIPVDGNELRKLAAASTMATKSGIESLGGNAQDLNHRSYGDADKTDRILRDLDRLPPERRREFIETVKILKNGEVFDEDDSNGNGNENGKKPIEIKAEKEE